MARRKGYHISAKARAARIGKKHPHKGYHGHRKFKGRHYHGRKTKGRKRHVATGRKHPHAGHGKGHPRVRKGRHTARRKTTVTRPITRRATTGRRAASRPHKGRYKFLSRFRRHSHHNRLRSQFVRRRYAFRNRFTRHRR